jgi:predicted DNA-binding transcriptional regulator AlpA
MYDIPETGFMRLPQVLTVIPVGKTCWWEGVKSGRYPKPVKLSPRCTAWRAEDIQALIKSLSNEPHDHHGQAASEATESEKPHE